MMNEDQEPKKIALKVPSLFIKSSSQPTSKESENGEEKKPSRPMPASMKRKLEEAKQRKNDSEESTSSGSQTPNSSHSQGVDEHSNRKPGSRPMPASAKRKLQGESVTTTCDTKFSDTNPKQEDSKRSNKPMPASAKSKLMQRDESSISNNKLEDVADGTNEVSKNSGEYNPVKKPMPASVKKKLEGNVKSEEVISTTVHKEVSEIEKTEDVKPTSTIVKTDLQVKCENSSVNSGSENESVSVANADDGNLLKAECNAKKKIVRPMPASARRKLESVISSAESKDQIAGEKSQENQDISKGNNDTVFDQTMVPKPEEDEDENHSEAKPAESVAAKESAKINISLGGIKFPTFKKPMPASVDTKTEGVKVSQTTTNEEKNEESLSSVTDHETENNQDTMDQSFRSNRGEIFSEKDNAETFSCGVCSKVFSNLLSKNKHEINHSKKSAPKKKKKESTSKYKGMTECPYCNRHYSSWHKVKVHASKCPNKRAKLAKYNCTQCSRSFESSSKLEAHLKVHEKTENEGNDGEYAEPIPISPMEFNDDSIASPVSESDDSKDDDSKSSSKHSAVERPRPMPKSVKAKVCKKDEGHARKFVSDASSVHSKDGKSFKSKISDVLTNLGTKIFNDVHKNTETDSDNEAEDEGPPRKKIILSADDTGDNESIRGHPMPASVKKKLQDRGNTDHNKKQATTTKPNSKTDMNQDLDDLECEVCHRVFTQMSNRQRHERNTHSILEPRGHKLTPGNKTVSKPVSVSKPVITTPKTEKTEKNIENIRKMDPSTIPTNGKCPICSKFIATRLKRHVKAVHKVTFTGDGNKSSSSPVIRPSAPKSYKIYKTATNKLKQKLSSSVSAKKPVIALEKLMSLSKVKEEIKKEVKTESNILATTASSDLRCACCDKIFVVKCDFYEHMAMRHSKAKRLITCKLCEHKFTHEEDFFLHVQFKHPDLVADMKQKSEKTPSVKLTKISTACSTKKNADTAKQNTSSTRSTRSVNKEPQNSRSEQEYKSISIEISYQDRKLAEDVLERKKSKPSETVAGLSSGSRNTRRSTKKLLTPEPELLDNDNESDHHFDDSGAMEMEVEEESEIAITSTFSQKMVTPPKKQTSTTGTFDLDPMHCSSCSEVFYSYEALRKHELYFHNVKTTKMCPICGVYPTRLARHLLAHENKTVRCSCVPCRLSFPEFSQLLKHNLEKHPGVKGGALCAPNKPRDQIQPEKSAKTEESDGGEVFRCLICKKEFQGGANARRHVRRTHSEQTADANTLVEKVGAEKSTNVQVDEEVEEILEDTNKKLLDPDWDADSSFEVEVPETPLQSKDDLKKSIRPMPASARAKLQLKQEDKTSVVTNDASNESNVQPPKHGVKPMPASVRAKLESQNKERKQSEPVTKHLSDSKSVSKANPSKPMPASVRAKLVSQTSSASENSMSSVNSGTKNAKRPMPASVKAKLGMAKAMDSVMGKKASHETVVEIIDDDDHVSTPKGSLEKNRHRVERNVNSSPEPIVTLDDDDDPMDDSLPDPDETSESITVTPSIPTFSIAEEIAEHNRAVQIAMGDHQTESSFSFSMFQCKLCNKKFESIEATRRHIRRVHSEYGPDHAENMIGKLYDDYANTPRRRQNNVRYSEDYVDDDDDEVIIPRGTSRRPRKDDTDTNWNSTESRVSPEFTNSTILYPSEPPERSSSPVLYECKWCGARKDSAGNIKRHIRRAHPHLFDKREQGINIVRASDEKFVEPEPPSIPPTSTKSCSSKAGNPIYVCTLCSKCMAVRSSLLQHILRAHQEVEKGEAAQYIQELNGNGSSSQNGDGSNEADPDNSYYCSICSYQTADEHEYVRHYKSHTGVSPYQCQYCSASFNRQLQLNAHITREHTGAEFLTNDEAEISMEEVVSSNQISVAATSKIHIDSPSSLSLSGSHSTESNRKSEPKKVRPGPASKKAALARKSTPSVSAVKDVPMDTEKSPPSSPSKPDEDEEIADTAVAIDTYQEKQRESNVLAYQGDLSSLFPTLGGGPAPGGIDALDGGMELD